MEFRVLDTTFRDVHILDAFESFIWTDRYSEYGDFEVCLAPTAENLDFLRQDYYIWSGETDRVMIIEDVRVQSDAEDGSKLIVTGRSLESLLERRIVWDQTILSGDFQAGIERLLRENVVSPADPARAAPGMIFEYSDDSAISALTINTQFTGQSIYDAVKKLCDANNLGFKVTLTDGNEFALSLYSGADRSYGQIQNPYVVFSPNFDNLINSNYFASKRELKTVTLVAGEGEGLARTKVAVEIESGAGIGWERRELYTDARDLSSNNGEVPSATYLKNLEQRGRNKLAENVVVKTFEGRADTLSKFVYGRDFFLGDIVQIANEYGVEAASRVTEVVRSRDAEGFEVFPTFATVL
jgi:hypothetical protein